jgi:hypothetical protein
VSLDVPCGSSQVVDLVSALHGGHQEKDLSILHNGYTDFVVFNAQAKRTAPVVGANLDGSWPTGTADSLAAGRSAMTAQRTFIGDFMDRYLAKD